MYGASWPATSPSQREVTCKPITEDRAGLGNILQYSVIGFPFIVLSLKGCMASKATSTAVATSDGGFRDLLSKINCLFKDQHVFNG